MATCVSVDDQDTLAEEGRVIRDCSMTARLAEISFPKSRGFKPHM